ncbi:MAG: 2-oxo-4-hydroxy-4-carboxy-5-ureidoimidazoline decarboxylase [Gammaproteobacteria bacterium]|nr:2-oxo-4-hydroxy-4-carboxy-5-ureidoimidazoline decarboxylase [Gammaproteobacteria bacterium]
MKLSLAEFNSAPRAVALLALESLFEKTPWVGEQTAEHRPFHSWTALYTFMVNLVAKAPKAVQMDLLLSHPELATPLVKQLTADSVHEQSTVGFNTCTEAELAVWRELNASYRHKFGWPFILAVKGPRGLGLAKQDILLSLQRRIKNHADFEFAECLRNVFRIVQLRMPTKFDYSPDEGNAIWDWHEELSQFSDEGFKENGQLTVTYLTQAHRACADYIMKTMLQAGFDEVYIDAVYNVVGKYHGASSNCKYLLTGSHYDTVRNAGKYDGRLGIFIPIRCVQKLSQSGTRMPFGLEVIAFSEEEGQRFPITFLGSKAITGHFPAEYLKARDSSGVTLAEVMESASLDIRSIGACQRDPQKYLSFVEVHIEQGPILNELNNPLGIVTSINGCARFLGQVTGVPCHAGTTPMLRRNDALCALAELVLYVESRAKLDADSVATVGQLEVRSGSINVVPGSCHFSLDVRAPSDTQRDALIDDIKKQMALIAINRKVEFQLNETLRMPSAPCDPTWMTQWERAVKLTGSPIYYLPSGAGHDAMQLAHLLPQSMLFVRGENSGISHNPLESTHADDIQLGYEAFMNLLINLNQEILQ